ncbi:hypothetical protein K457DRAFT_26579 [Linnemannia elongata AG-77]|uniref:Uncharacterized protein n=1 Tax=Linnemannia elongata AG-77 TaxID=1314771 RepID=A0A197JE64_9FUNG|nr:hypothetical protein K457DRAFT_1882923 [Linnemannia elongata AG-77]OAQ22791.1 hypothetical protein K457DRAFT_26579 [Linnemannia elongata AG-77]
MHSVCNALLDSNTGSPPPQPGNVFWSYVDTLSTLSIYPTGSSTWSTRQHIAQKQEPSKSGVGIAYIEDIPKLHKVVRIVIVK